jgi:hypothetical protein
MQDSWTWRSPEPAKALICLIRHSRLSKRCNYVEGDTVNHIDRIWEELARREELIRNAYREIGIPLNADQGLASALREAKELAAGQKTSKALTNDSLLETVQACHVIYSIADSIEICLNAGLDISRQLAQMATGTVDYGTPAGTSAKNIYLKDFEYELFIASCLIRDGVKPQFLENPSDPTGEMIVDDIILECKHPNSCGQLTKNIAKFGKNLQDTGKFGVFLVAVEDANNLGDAATFDTENEYRAWLESKRDKMEISGRERAAYASRFEKIVGLVHTQSKVLVVGENTSMQRLGTSILFDHQEGFCTVLSTAIAIARAFNPRPILYSEVNKELKAVATETGDVSEKAGG